MHRLEVGCSTGQQRLQGQRKGAVQRSAERPGEQRGQPNSRRRIRYENCSALSRHEVVHLCMTRKIVKERN